MPKLCPRESYVHTAFVLVRFSSLALNTLPSSTAQERGRLLERLEQRPLKLRPKEDVERVIRGLSAAEEDLLMDLRPFMQRNPFVVQADASLSRAYRLFRTMGLRHLFVAPPQPKAGPCNYIVVVAPPHPTANTYISNLLLCARPTPACSAHTACAPWVGSFCAYVHRGYAGASLRC